MYEHPSSAFMIAEMELENRFSALLHVDTNRNSMSLPLICANLIFLMLCCNKLFAMQAIRFKIAQTMCDGRSLTSSPVRRLAGRGLFLLCGSLFSGGTCLLHSVCADACPYMTKCFVIEKSLKHSAAVLTTPRLAIFIPPFGLTNVTQY